MGERGSSTSKNVVTYQGGEDRVVTTARGRGQGDDREREQMLNPSLQEIHCTSKEASMA